MSNGTICTGEGVTMFQLVAVRGALRLEKAGMKHSRGSVRKMWAATLGLKPRDSHDKFIEAINNKIAEVETRLKAGDIEQF